MCLPSQASACGVCAGEGSRRRSVIAGSFTLRTKTHSRRESRKKRCSGSRVGCISAIRPSNELCKGLADCVCPNESISHGSVARRFFCSAKPLIAHAPRVPRCPWATTEPAIAYHDEEWGVPVHDDRMLFEFLILEGAQAGLSWITILKKRNNYRKAFDGFRAEKIARYGAREMKRLLSDAGIIRNRLKIAATISNAKSVSRVARRNGKLRRLPLEFRRRQTDTEPVAEYDGRAGAYQGILRDEPQSVAAGIQVRGLDNLLRADASDRHGQRPSLKMSATRGTRRRAPAQVTKRTQLTSSDMNCKLKSRRQRHHPAQRGKRSRWNIDANAARTVAAALCGTVGIIFLIAGRLFGHLLVSSDNKAVPEEARV